MTDVESKHADNNNHNTNCCGRCTELLGELEAAQASSRQSQHQLQNTLQEHQAQHLHWETEKTQLQVPPCNA